jgi:hypothetical protein
LSRGKRPSLADPQHQYVLPVALKVSAKNARLRFIECGPACIAQGCEAKCCDAPTSTTGIRITIHPSEVQGITNRGGVVDQDGYLLPRPGERLCPFKGEDHLCTLHGSPDKPFGCRASPFMINKNNTLIIRNRYKLLPCYTKDGGQPAYITFFSSLVDIFGLKSANILKDHLDNGGDDIAFTIPYDTYDLLSKREEILHG